MAVTLTSHTSAHSITATVAPFRAWRDSRLAVARGPMRDTIESQRGIIGGLGDKCNRYNNKLGNAVKSQPKRLLCRERAASGTSLTFT